MVACDFRFLHYNTYVRMQHFVRRTTSNHFRRFYGDATSFFLLLFMVLRVFISVTLCGRAVLMLWHAFLFLGRRFFPLFLFLLDGLHCRVGHEKAADHEPCKYISISKLQFQIK
jgi:hypothetical protein